MFAAATGAAFINGLSRFALLFVFVFYYQGAQGDDPITAGIKLAPMAIGMLVASPLAGIWADRHGSRTLAALGMLVSAVALAVMTTLQADTAYWQSMLWLALVGIGSGMFNSPNTAAMMGTVPAERRGIAAGARTMLQNTGAVISIAFVLAIVTAAVPKPVLFKIFSGLASGLTSAQLEPFIHNMHTALWVLAATSVLGAGVSLLRPSQHRVRAIRRRAAPRRRSRGDRGDAMSAGELRIGDVAKLTGTTPRTIRYYEEIGLLPGAGEREPGAHRTYEEADVERLTELLRLKDLLGALAGGAEGAGRGRGGPRRAAPRVARRRRGPGPAAPDPRRGLGHIANQLELVRRRRDEIGKLEEELLATAQAGAAGAYAGVCSSKCLLSIVTWPW